ncbi:MAG: nucleoside deaminase [Erysipelotrichaceae bacterium]
MESVLKMSNKLKWMKQAMKQAEKAALLDEVPVGCVIVKDGKCIAKGYNKKEKTQRVSDHAEMIAIAKASRKLGTWRLEECELYVTLEPCAMCASAILQSRIKKVYFATYEPKGGALGSTFNMYEIPGFNHYPEIEGGIIQEESSQLLKQFFKEKRVKKQR